MAKKVIKFILMENDAQSSRKNVSWILKLLR